MAQFKASSVCQAIRVFTYTQEARPPNKILYAVIASILWIISCWLVVFPVVHYWSLQRSLKEETLSIIKDVGIQLTKVRKDGSTSHQFYERSVVRDVVINEALTPYDAYFYLAFIVVDQGEVIVPFQHFKLSLAQVKEVYYCSQELLFK
mmetsp:Transcript_22649/g.40780  ORF Transcript_22649/g.40780 Transcript_22649/m.40780 type:complete len:149 (+) Transcript_22649:1545-1991(+)